MRKKRKRRKEKDNTEAASMSTVKDHQMRVYEIGKGAGSSQMVDKIVTIAENLSVGTIPPPPIHTSLSTPTTIGATANVNIPATARTMID